MSESTVEVIQKSDDVLTMTKEVVAHELKLHAVLKRHIKEKNCKHCKKILKEAWGIELVNEELYDRFAEHDRKLDDVINKTNYVIDQTEKIIVGLNKHLEETDCEHCKQVLRKIFPEEMN